jgi:DNA polymerase I-like protein with 3'-5' exonuclease and polymerase domains
MIGTHVIDERRGCTSLDFQNLVRFGIPAYNAKTKSFLKIKEEEGKIIKVNRIREAKKEDLIQYGGLDAITTFNNWQLLKKIMEEKYPKAKENYEFLKKGHWAFANMSKRGVYIDMAEHQRLIDYFNDEMEKILKRILEIPEFAEYNAFIKKSKHPEKEKIESIRDKLKIKHTSGIVNRFKLKTVPIKKFKLKTI